jgi:trigger factor
MQVSVEAPSKIERRVTVIVPVETVDEAYDKRIIDLTKTATVKGFRPGKVPVEYIKQRYGDSARQEALSEVIQSSLYAAINQEKLNPVGTPAVLPKTMMPGQPLEFVATFEVLPEVSEVHFDVDTLERVASTVTEDDIKKVIEHLRSQHVTWNKVDRPAQEKDQVVLDFRGLMNGKPFPGGEAKDYPIVLGSKMMIPGFEDGLVGAKAGEEKILAVIFPENYFAKEFAGKAAEFETKILKVSEPSYPELDAAFAKKLGVKSGTVEDLNAEVRKNLERELERLTKAQLKSKVFAKLLEQNPVDVPKALIDREANRIHNQVHPHHGEHDHNHSEAEMQGFKDAAKKNVVLGLLVGELIKKYSITPDKARVEQFITGHAAAYENPKEVVSWYSNNKRRLAEVEMQVLEEQVMEKLLENVKLTEKMLSYEEFAKSVRQQ